MLARQPFRRSRLIRVTSVSLLFNEFGMLSQSCTSAARIDLPARGRKHEHAPPFVHLHCHSHYSLLDGASPIDKLIERAKSLGMNGLAMTDHGNLHGALEFYQDVPRKRASIRFWVTKPTSRPTAGRNAMPAI